MLTAFAVDQRKEDFGPVRVLDVHVLSQRRLLAVAQVAHAADEFSYNLVLFSPLPRQFFPIAMVLLHGRLLVLGLMRGK